MGKQETYDGVLFWDGRKRGGRGRPCAVSDDYIRFWRFVFLGCVYFWERERDMGWRLRRKGWEYYTLGCLHVSTHTHITNAHTKAKSWELGPGYGNGVLFAGIYKEIEFCFCA
jgi:hypothetical protein